MTSISLSGKILLPASSGISLQKLSTSAINSPTDVSGLVAWFKADSLSLNDGDAVTTWTDSSGNGNDATQSTAGNKPTYKASRLNGKPYLSFDGGDGLVVANESNFDLATPTIIIVARRTSGTGVFMGKSTTGSSSNDRRKLQMSGSTTSFNYSSGADASPTVSVTATGTNFNIVSLVTRANNDHDIVINGTVTNSTNSLADSTTNNASLIIGSNFAAGTESLTGDIAEIIIYNKALSTAERTALEAYLDAKYAITTFNPSIATGLQIWLKADALSLNDGDAVSSWTDSSGNGYAPTQATEGARPTYKVNIVNGKPVVRFDGGDSLQNSAFPAFGTNDFTLFVVATTPTVSGYNTIYMFGNQTTDEGYLLTTDGANNDGTLIHGRWGNDFLNTTAPQLSINTFYALTATDSSNTYTPLVNGSATTAASATTTINVVGNGFCIGDTINTSNYPWDGDVAEFIFYNRAMSATERGFVHDYLETKYGITIA